MRLSLKVRELNDVTVVGCRGRIAYRDEAAALSVRALALLKQKRPLIFDLSELDGIDCVGLGTLAEILGRARQSQIPIALSGARGLVRQVLDLTRLSSVFSLYSSVDQAVAQLRRGCQLPRLSTFAMETIASAPLL